MDKNIPSVSPVRSDAAFSNKDNSFQLGMKQDDTFFMLDKEMLEMKSDAPSKKTKTKNDKKKNKRMETHSPMKFDNP